MKAVLLLVFISLTTLGSLPAYAGGHKPAFAIAAMGIANARGSKSLQVNSSQQAVQLVKRQYSGKVLKVQSANVRGGAGYRVKLLSKDGVVFYVNVNAKTGRVSRK
ncbi:PepSY domain-containing protein [Shewanella youngdeokensis]|uniref:PepSY domain-containing protein n=1 Tax=Shewanella youngdeokensis TaxID=2999068 RepID=A0ABZ0K0R1_9GAMM|nr:PepSY domain-containing protein [Shewanella sp. DAU334]